MSKEKANKFLNKYVTALGEAAAVAGAGTGAAVAVDRMMHTDEDHAGEKIIVVKQSYAATLLRTAQFLTSTEKKV